jgi:hypothetical protein
VPGAEALSTGGNELVAAPGNGFDEAGFFGGVAESFAKPVDGRIEAMLEVDKRIGRPEAAMQLFPCDHTSGALQQDN